MVVDLLLAEGRAEGQIHMTKSFFAFRNCFAKESKTEIVQFRLVRF